MIPIITIDGPASSGKGTVARLVAKKLGFHYLESGAIYRALGLWISLCADVETVSTYDIVKLIDKMNLQFKDGNVFLDGNDVTLDLRSENVGMLASKFGAIPEVRARLLQFQRDFAVSPGLVTDGRDMGSVVFPDAGLKIFLTATPECRADRRYKQLQQLEKPATIESILQDIIARDASDSSRSTAPLKFDETYKVLDNSNLTIEQTIEQILSWYNS